MSSVVVSARGEQRIRVGHPWIYRADVVDVQAAGGDTVEVIGPRKRTLGHALYSDRSQISLRMLTRGEAPFDESILRARLERAIRFRETLGLDADAYRLVHAEAVPAERRFAGRVHGVVQAVLHQAVLDEHGEVRFEQPQQLALEERPQLEQEQPHRPAQPHHEPPHDADRHVVEQLDLRLHAPDLRPPDVPPLQVPRRHRASLFEQPAVAPRRLIRGRKPRNDGAGRRDGGSASR